MAIGQDADQNQAEMHGGLYAVGSANSCLRVAVKGGGIPGTGEGVRPRRLEGAVRSPLRPMMAPPLGRSMRARH